jgi:hypothetical protein
MPGSDESLQLRDSRGERSSVATSKAAMCGHFKTGHMKRRPGQGFLLLQSVLKQQTF